MKKLLDKKLLLISIVAIFIGMISSQVFAVPKNRTLKVKDLENVTLSPEAKPIFGRSEWHFKTSDGTFLGILIIEDGRTIYSDGTFSNRPSPLNITYYGPDAVETGSSLEITYDDGETADIYLPALLTTTTLQVGVDGSTYYDADQTILAQEESSDPEGGGKSKKTKIQWYSRPGGYGHGRHIGLNGSVDFGFRRVKKEIPIVFRITDGGMHAEPFDVSISGLNEKLLYSRKRTCYKPKENSDCGEYTISYTYFAPAVNEGAKIMVTDKGTNHKLDKDQQGADIYFSAHNAIEIKKPYGHTKYSANDYNERSFNTILPGKLTVICEAKVTPPEIAGEVSDKLKWKIKTIKKSELTWDNSWPGDPKSGKGIGPLTATFTGLPQSNDDFGLRKIELYFVKDRKETFLKQAYIETFFEKEAKNHPGGQAGSPNWYYYWGELVPPEATRYWRSEEYGGPFGTDVGYFYFLFREGHKGFIEIYNVNRSSIKDCTGVMAHENWHAIDWRGVWPSGYGVDGEDSDSDHLRDAWELGKNPTQDPSQPFFIGQNDWSYFKDTWSENNANWAEVAERRKPHEKADWSKGGANWDH